MNGLGWLPQDILEWLNKKKSNDNNKPFDQKDQFWDDKWNLVMKYEYFVNKNMILIHENGVNHIN